MAVKDLLQNLGQRLTGGTYQQFVLIFILVATFYIVVNEVVRYQARIPTLKGPSGLPLIGNLHQIRTNAAEQYRKWAKSFGAVYQIQLGNIPIVVVNSAAAARVIFGKNSNALSSRPEFYTFHKVLISLEKAYQWTKFDRYCQLQQALQLALRHIVIL